MVCQKISFHNSVPSLESPRTPPLVIIYALGNSGHTLSHSSFNQFLMKGPVCILQSSVTMTQGMGIGLRQDCCIKGIEYQFIAIRISNPVGHNPTVIQIQDSTQIYFVFFSILIVLEFGYIGEPFLIWRICRKFSIQYIFSNILWIGCLPCATVIAVLNG